MLYLFCSVPVPLRLVLRREVTDALSPISWFPFGNVIRICISYSVDTYISPRFSTCSLCAVVPRILFSLDFLKA